MNWIWSVFNSGKKTYTHSLTPNQAATKIQLCWRNYYAHKLFNTPIITKLSLNSIDEYVYNRVKTIRGDDINNQRSLSASEWINNNEYASEKQFWNRQRNMIKNRERELVNFYGNDHSPPGKRIKKTLTDDIDVVNQITHEKTSYRREIYGQLVELLLYGKEGISWGHSLPEQTRERGFNYGQLFYHTSSKKVMLYQDIEDTWKPIW